VLRPATDRDWLDIVGMQAPDFHIGYVAEVAGVPTALGCLIHGDNGRWWLTMKRRGEMSRFTLWRATQRVLSVARDAKVTVHAIADARVAGSERFLERLGFVASGEFYDQHKVFQWTP
jgi:hypothetical protein